MTSGSLLLSLFGVVSLLYEVDQKKHEMHSTLRFMLYELHDIVLRFYKDRELLCFTYPNSFDELYLCCYISTHINCWAICIPELDIGNYTSSLHSQGCRPSY